MKIGVFIALVVRLHLVHAEPELFTLNITCVCEKGEDYTELFLIYEFSIRDKLDNGQLTRIGKQQKADNVLGSDQQNGTFNMQLPKLNEKDAKRYKINSKSLELYIEVWDNDGFGDRSDFLGRVTFRNFQPQCAAESASKYPSQCARKNFEICGNGQLCIARSTIKGRAGMYGNYGRHKAYYVQCPRGTPCFDKTLEIKFSYYF